MLTKFKKTVAAILVMTMLTTMFTIAPAAVETNNEKPTSDAMNYSVAGNNDLGDILADEITEYQSQNDNSECSYTISEITMSENVATVTYSTEKDCTILVAVYDENTDKMLASGKAEALAKTNSAVVTLETDSMPKNFVLRGFMLNDSNAPMSEAYYSNMHTTDMQQLLQSTVDDYDAEKVLNIDDNPSTNFMVYSDDVQKFDCNDNANTIEKVDSNGDSYVFTNADDKLKGLKPGDIFVCDDNPQNPVIFKVGEISTEGDTVTVKTAEVSLEQAFECVKIESAGSADDAEIDESMVSPGMKYVGAPKDEEATADKKPVSSVGASYDGDSVGALVDIDKEEEYEHEFEIGDLGKEIEGKYAKFEGKLGGSISVGGAVNVSIYLSFKGKKSVSLSADFKAYYKLYVEGSFNFDVPFVKIPIPVAAKALVVEFDIAFVLEASGKFEMAYETSCSIGFSYASGKGFKNTSRAPKVDYSTNVEGELYVAFKLTVAVVTGDKDIASVGLNAEIGADITASPTIPNIDIKGVTVNHDCKKCVSGDISLVLKIYPEVVFLKKNVIKSISDDIKKDFEYKKKLTPWYYSFTHKDFGFDICRYANVSFNIKVVKDGKAVENAEIMDILNGVYLGTTDNTGKLYVTLDGNDSGLYQIHADKDNVEANTAIRIKPFNDILALENQEWKSFKEADNYNDGCYEIELGSNNVPEPTTEPTTTPEETEPVVTEPQVQLLDSGKCGDNITYEYLSNNTLRLKGTGRMYDYQSSTTMPWDKYIDKIISIDISQGITYIGNYTFCGCRSITNITIPNSVTNIGYYAFHSCSNLTSVTILTGVTIIGDFAFSSCENLTSIIIPNSVTSIGDGVFSNCSSLTNITIPNSVTSIGNSAFSWCENLISIIVPSSVTNISANTFNCCSSLKNITIPNSVTTIGDCAFGGCNSLTSITIPDSVSQIGDSAFGDCSNLISIVIPNSVTSIGDEVFASCSSLTNITIPNSVTSIGKGAFSGCNSLTSITIPGSVTSISDYAFSHCGNLKSVTLLNGIKSIGYLSFWLCTSLTSITIPNSVTSIGESAFWCCSNLTSITIPSSVTNIGNEAFKDCRNLISVTNMSGVTSIGESVFDNCSKLTRIAIPIGLICIGDSAFSGCHSLTSITIPSSVTSIGEGAFSGCHSLTSITIPSGVTSIASNAFFNCSNLTSVTLSKHTTIGSNAFYGCSSNLTFHYYEDETTTKSTKSAISSVSAQNETVTTRTAEYSNETAYAYYIIAAVKDETAEDVLSADNLIYIIQTTADEKGNISSDLAIPADVTDYDVVLYGPGSLSVNRIRIGDVNLNGEIQIDDVTHLQKNIAKITTLSKDARAAADCDGNGDINIKDATLIQMYLAGFETNGRVGEGINNDKAATTEPETTEPATTEPVTTEPVTTTPVTTEPATQPATTNSTYTMTFTNNRNWDKVCCYYWSGDTNNNWPGTEMTYSYTNDFGEKIYTIEIPDTAQNVIFNNGGNGQQTVDITVNGSAKYYISGGSGTSCTVANW